MHYFYHKSHSNILIVLLFLLLSFKVLSDSTSNTNIAVVLLSYDVNKKLSNLDKKPKNLGIAGGVIAVKDNNTTGSFIGEKFNITSFKSNKIKEIKIKIATLITQNYQHIVLDVPSDLLLSMSTRYSSKDVLFYNIGNKDNKLRNQDCRKNIIHIAPSYAMLADAIAQFLVYKNWKKWLLITGQKANDKKFAEAIKKSSKKFGGRIIKEKQWNFGPDSRRTAQKEIPVFTQGIDYDMLIVADEVGEFGEYIIYQTWLPILVSGTQGLMPTTWHKTHEKWGAAQLQSRFYKRYERKMRALDYQVWLAIRGIGEAVTQTHSSQFAIVKQYLFGAQFSIAGFKGRKLTFRDWNHQLRQPILLVSANSLVSVSPQKKFLHQYSNLDTLGLSKENTQCRM
ncbi:hypothetical protein [uncultured Gammaproteobacteria bacterium]|jgi:ABC transporter substrate binding protein (PQQ-dependent alcohol dehydrogenase system)|nr:hypothetical protein [uncultured Gammaproteobacteria bacterium]CAC9525290.1 FIG00445410: hypothetical protein [uncultured Gammaproteobacteria bacterium]